MGSSPAPRAAASGILLNTGELALPREVNQPARLIASIFHFLITVLGGDISTVNIGQMYDTVDT